MKPHRYLALLILGLILVPGLPVSGIQEAQAMPLRADGWQEVTFALLEREELQPTGSDTAALRFVEEANLTALDAADSDYFGISASISGNTVVVGAFYKDDEGSKRGAAYVYAHNQGGAGSWGQVKKLSAADAADEDWFGGSVAISGDVIVVGAGGEDGAGSDRGAAYVYARNEGGTDSWGQVKKLTASDAENLDNFGSSVAVSGDIVVVGAPREDGEGRERGAVYVFARNQDGADRWGQVKKLTAADAADYVEFGRVAISGDTVIVGAPFESNRRGAVYVFERNQGGVDSWGQVKKLAAADAADYDFFGGFVAIEADTVVVGATGEDGAGTSRGAAYVFARNEGGVDSWGQVQKLTAADAADNDWFGDTATISGDTVVVGADWKDDGGSKRGAAYVYARNQGGVDSWGQVQKLTAPNATEFSFFGLPVAISGDVLVAGAHGKDNRRGTVYVFGLQQVFNTCLPLTVRTE